jgi:hypothetical protein
MARCGGMVFGVTLGRRMAHAYQIHTPHAIPHALPAPLQAFSPVALPVFHPLALKWSLRILLQPRTSQWNRISSWVPSISPKAPSRERLSSRVSRRPLRQCLKRVWGMERVWLSRSFPSEANRFLAVCWSDCYKGQLTSPTEPTLR